MYIYIHIYSVSLSLSLSLSLYLSLSFMQEGMTQCCRELSLWCHTIIVFAFAGQQKNVFVFVVDDNIHILRCRW